MNKLTLAFTKGWQDREKPLRILFYIFLFLPCAYAIYIGSLLISTNTSLSLLFSSTSEGLNLLMYLSSLYSAYVIQQVYKYEKNRMSVFILVILTITQVLFMNYISIALLIYYVYQNKHAIKSWLQHKEIQKSSRNALVVSLLVLLCAMIVTFAKFQLQILF